ncbi:MAG: hypothetical protein ACRENX_05885 [Candidatus Dormibacteria bacterium]
MSIAVVLALGTIVVVMSSATPGRVEYLVHGYAYQLGVPHSGNLSSGPGLPTCGPGGGKTTCIRTLKPAHSSLVLIDLLLGLVVLVGTGLML